MDVICIKGQFIRRFIAMTLAITMAAAFQFSALAAAEIHPKDPRRDIINSIEELNEASPGSPELSAYIDEILPDIISDDMDYFEQVKACYDYVRDNTRYGAHYTDANMSTRIGGTTIRAIYQKYGEVEGFGAVALKNHVGLCNAYASAFIMLVRKIGFDAYLVKGSTKGSGGGYLYHEWCEININGTAYVFDPQLDQNLARSLGDYKVFGATYDQIPGRYRK